MLSLLLLVGLLSLLLFHCASKKKDSPELVNTLKSQKILPAEKQKTVIKPPPPPEPNKSKVEVRKKTEKKLDEAKTPKNPEKKLVEKKSDKKNETEGQQSTVQQQQQANGKKIADEVMGPTSAGKKSKKEPRHKSFKYEPPPVEQRPKKPENFKEKDPHIKSTRSLEFVKGEIGFE